MTSERLTINAARLGAGQERCLSGRYSLSHIESEGGIGRERLRNGIFFENAYSHWQAAVREPQNPRPAPEPIQTPKARREHTPV
jgi:hypothetical protein